jgi:hypothetical protein
VLDPAKMIMCQNGGAAINGCDTQLDAWNRCSVCLPETGDMACATCSKGSCCDEVGNWVLSADSQAFFDCATACTTQACFDGCETMYPAAAAANTALGECQDDSCPEECICAASSSDTTCTACAKGSCCADYVDYLLAPDFADFDTCAAECADDPCFEACIGMYPTAGAAFDALSTCLNGSCMTQCAG